MAFAKCPGVAILVLVCLGLSSANRLLLDTITIHDQNSPIIPTSGEKWARGYGSGIGIGVGTGSGASGSGYGSGTGMGYGGGLGNVPFYGPVPGWNPGYGNSPGSYVPGIGIVPGAPYFGYPPYPYGPVYNCPFPPCGAPINGPPIPPKCPLHCHVRGLQLGPECVGCFMPAGKPQGHGTNSGKPTKNGETGTAKVAVNEPGRII